MRDRLMRSMMFVALAVVAIMGIPVITARWVFLRLSTPEKQLLVEELSSVTGIVLIIAAVSVQAAIALAITALIARRQARAFAAPMSELADRAERLGAGESRFQPLDTGIAEVDRVSAVLSRSAMSVTASLAAERDFASDASHQLRTPLTALLMRLEEIAMTDDLGVVREEANIAIDQVERLTNVVDELLARTRHAEVDHVLISLDSVIAALQREWQPAFARARRSVRVHGERGLRVQVTTVALSQILSCLFENALRHGHGTVDVEARRMGPSVVVEVSDQGPGISPSIAPHIFERSVSSSGTGLGLALARDLAEANGGRLELIDAAPAVFALFLSAPEQS